MPPIEEDLVNVIWIKVSEGPPEDTLTAMQAFATSSPRCSAGSRHLQSPPTSGLLRSFSTWVSRLRRSSPGAAFPRDHSLRQWSMTSCSPDGRRNVPAQWRLSLLASKLKPLRCQRRWKCSCHDSIFHSSQCSAMRPKPSLSLTKILILRGQRLSIALLGSWSWWTALIVW